MTKTTATPPQQPKLKVEVKNNHLRIFIDGLLHASIDADEIVALTSYKSAGYFHIDYYTEKATVEFTYKPESEELWKGILKELEKIKII